MKRTGERAAYYVADARHLREGLAPARLGLVEGENAPWFWMSTSEGLSPSDCFDRLLEGARVVTTPGAGFVVAGTG